MHKAEIAMALEEIGTLLELKGENPFKTRAYHNGARLLESMGETEFAQLLATEALESVKGFGEALAKKIVTLHRTGRLELLERLRAETPPGLLELLQVPGLGPKKVRVLSAKLGLSTLAELQKACLEGRVAELEGFGAKSQEKILSGIRNREAYGRRHLWSQAERVALPLLEGLRRLPGVLQAEAAGSLRRGLETVGDLDFLVAAVEAEPVMDWFCALPDVREVTGRGGTKASVRFASGLQADLRLVPQTQFPFALHHFTGSKDHNIQMRQRALARGWSLSEWGLALVEGVPGQAPASPPPAIVDEKGLFCALELAYIPPELREGLGELEAAERQALPRLVNGGELRGALHNHTDASDGLHSLEEMHQAAADLGWDYLGIADHSRSSVQAKGLDEQRLGEQVKRLRALNGSTQLRTQLLAGTECDILPDGTLDFDLSVRRQLDYVVVSVHSAFTQDEATLTRRILRAVESPAVHILGHLSGRLLLRREPYAVSYEKVIDACIANGVVIELNANPERLDMDWRHWRRAAERGLLCVINPDAHTKGQLAQVRYGLLAARKGWLTAEQVLNTWSLERLRAFFARRL